VIIIFEGFDNCGKSTIAKALSKKMFMPLMTNDKSNLSLIKNFNFEDSFRYCIPKFFQYYDQRFIKDIIFDRDYMSEFVYGYLKRQEDFLSKSILSTCLQFDLEYFKRDTVIVYCYKTEIKDYKDEETPIDLKKQAEERYLEIINRSYNKVLMLNTDSQDLEAQLEMIMSFIDRHKVLEVLNTNIYRDKSTEGRIFFPGLFYGDEILFVGQNPGRPTENQVEDIPVHTKVFQKYKDFEFEHHKSYFKSTFYKFLSKFAQSEFGLNNKQFSFTNIVKFSTEKDRPPTSDEIQYCERLLTAQINVLKPKRIVSFGKPSHELLSKNGVEHTAYYHPSYFRYHKTELIKEA